MFIEQLRYVSLADIEKMCYDGDREAIRQLKWVFKILENELGVSADEVIDCLEHDSPDLAVEEIRTIWKDFGIENI